MRFPTLALPALLLGAMVATPVAAAERCNPGQFVNFPHECVRNDPLLGGPFQHVEGIVEDVEELAGSVPGIVTGAVGEALAKAGEAAESAGELAGEARQVAEEAAASARETIERRVAESVPEECPLVRPITPSQTVDEAIRAAIAQIPSTAGREQAEATYEDVQHLDWWCEEQLGRL